MTPTTSEPGRNDGPQIALGAVAAQLNQESEKLRQLAEELSASEAAQAEVRANYPHLKQAVYASLREQFGRELPPLPDKDLDTVAAEEGALPLEAFIDQLDPPAKGR